MSNSSSIPPNSFVLVSGSSSGIGRDMAVQLSSHNRLILNGRDMERLQETLGCCSNPNEHIIWRYDLTDTDHLGDELASLLKQHSIYVSGFIHCAAQLTILPLRSQTLDMIRANMNVNFLSAMEIVRTLTRRRVNLHELRSVVFISSIASSFGAKGFSAYSASKAALDGLMKSLAVEMAPAVRFNSVLPGAVKTPMTAEIFANPEVASKFERDYPLGVGLAADVINMVEFLISEKARWITGQQFIVDGGRTTAISA